MRLGNREARGIFLARHGLSAPPNGPAKSQALADVITDLGFVQLDSVRTVERAHHMILAARRQSYRPAYLDPLLDPRRDLFEHWTHDAAVIPMAFYPHWQLRFERDAQLLRRRYKSWQQHDFEHLCDQILGRIRAQGPVSSGDLGEGEARATTGWWDWAPSKTALEYLWRSGALAVTRRDGFRKVYDLAERVIPSQLFDQRPTVRETTDFLCRGALQRLGFATAGEIAAFWDTLKPHEVHPWLQDAQQRGEVMPIEITCVDGTIRKSFALTDQDFCGPKPPGRMRVLSPFDPALRDRARAQRLFGFHYRIEIFVPAAKRQYGYYVFPLLEGDRLVGRIDIKRTEGDLHVTALWPEAGVRWGDARHARLQAELTRVAGFAGLDQVTWADDFMRAQ